MAFCVTDDHARQDQLVEVITRGELSPSAWNVRRYLERRRR
jgi:hypothetical protein